METRRIARCIIAASMLALFVEDGGLTRATESEQVSDVRSVIATFMEQVRVGGGDWRPVNAILATRGKAVAHTLEDYFEDSDPDIRWHSYAALVKVGLAAEDVMLRQMSVDRLLKRLDEEEDIGNRQFLGSRLREFTSVDFSEQAQQRLQELFSKIVHDDERDGYFRIDILLLVGVADMKSEIPLLKTFLDKREQRLKKQHERNVNRLQAQMEEASKRGKRPRQSIVRMLEKQYWQDTSMWAALRARARMGVKEDIQRCIELVEAHPSEGYRVTRLLDQLAYVRQPQVVDHLRSYLESDEPSPYAAADVVGQSYAQHAAAALAKMLRRFPGNKDYGGNKQTIKVCRKWMSEQKEWSIIR